MDCILWIAYYGLYTMDCILWILYYGLYTMGCILWVVYYGIPLEKLLWSYHSGALRNLLYQLETYYKIQMSKLSPELNLRVRLHLLARLSHFRVLRLYGMQPYDTVNVLV